MIRRLSCLALLVALACPVAAQDAPKGDPAPAAKDAPDFSEEGMTARFASKLQPALEEVLGAKLGEPVPFTRQTVEGMAKVIEADNLRLLASLEGGLRGEEFAEQCAAIGKQLAPMVMGKVDLETGGLQVVAEGFALMASLGGDAWAGVNTQPFVDVILIHEAVHVYQNRTYDLNAFMGQPTTLGELRGRMSVIEGHAQWVTRRVAEKLGLADSFALFNSTNTEVPPTVTNELMRARFKTQGANLAFPYVQGETFVTALFEELGPKPALDRLFKSPPTSMRQVSHYEEYLNPPKDAVDVTALGRNVQAIFPAADYLSQVVPLPEASARAALGLAGPEAVDEALATFQAASVVVANSRAVPGEQVIVLIADLKTPEGTVAMLEAEEVVSRKKDEQIRAPGSGMTLESAVYEEGLEGSGFYVRKLVTVPGQAEPITARSLIFTTDRFLIELVYNRVDGDGAAARELGAKIAGALKGGE